MKIKWSPRTREFFSFIIFKIFLIWLISGCAYEPNTIVKVLRPSNAKVSLNKKTNTSVDAKLNANLSHTAERFKKRTGPAVKIDFSNFKRNLIGLSNFEIIELLDKP